MIENISLEVRRRKLSYLGPERFDSLYECVNAVQQFNAPGDFTEFGVALGGSGICLATALDARAVQRSVLSPKCNTIQRSEAQREVEDSADGKSLNLCEATESFGGRLEVVRTSSFAVRDNSRPASGRG